jgi:hypothetical protein
MATRTSEADEIPQDLIARAIKRDAPEAGNAA